MRIFIEPTKESGLGPTFLPDVRTISIDKGKLIIDVYGGLTVNYKLDQIQFAESDRDSKSPVRPADRRYRR